MLRRLRPMRIVLGLTFIVALLLMTHGSAWAQSPGTIKGIVKDGETGDLLDYANVIIKGTTRGTMSLGGGGNGRWAVKVLHVLDHYLPHHSGYTFRSSNLLEQQRNLGLSPVVPTGTSPWVPSAICQSTNASSAASSISPSLNGVTRATREPLNISLVSDHSEFCCAVR